VAGCGASDEDEARAAVEKYVQALNEGDSEAACEQLTEGATQQIEEQFDDDCAGALDQAIGAVGEAGASFEDLEVGDVNVEGETATATIEAPGGSTTTELTKEDGDWKLASPG